MLGGGAVSTRLPHVAGPGPVLPALQARPHPLYNWSEDASSEWSARAEFHAVLCKFPDTDLFA